MDFGLLIKIVYGSGVSGFVGPSSVEKGSYRCVSEFFNTSESSPCACKLKAPMSTHQIV